MSRNPKALTARSQLSTAAFKAWFAHSLVVDVDGRPLVAYHGTTRDITQFKVGDRAYSGLATSELGAWFAAPSDRSFSVIDDIRMARKAAENFSYNQQDIDGGLPCVYQVYLSIKNPLVFEAFGDLQEAVDASGSVAQFRLKAEVNGYDGIVVRGSRTDSGEMRDDWVAFRPEQIKSATGNNGDFCGTNPDIRFSNCERAR